MNEGFVISLLQNIGVAVTVPELASSTVLKKRPIKVYFSSEVDKINVMKNLKHLKGTSISITEDYTVAVREMSEEIKTKNSLQLPYSK